MQSARVKIGNPTGVHARPASLLAECAGGFASDIRLRAGGGAPVDAKSMVLLLSLGLRQGDVVELEAEGPDAASALEKLKKLLSGPLG